MTPKPGETYVAAIPWGRSVDPRPCIVIEVLAHERVLVVALSSALQLFNSSIHFSISDTHSDFSATGLKRRSYVDGTKFHEIHFRQLLKLLGRMDGQLARDFEKWIE